MNFNLPLGLADVGYGLCTLWARTATPEKFGSESDRQSASVGARTEARRLSSSQVPVPGRWAPRADRRVLSWRVQAWGQSPAMQKDVASGRAWRDVCKTGGRS